jgi:hypothetical protein
MKTRDITMSRSRKKHPFSGITVAESEKQEKRRANRKERRAVKTALIADSEMLPHRREVSDVWAMSKDRKRRFDPVKYPKILRK